MHKQLQKNLRSIVSLRWNPSIGLPVGWMVLARKRPLALMFALIWLAAKYQRKQRLVEVLL